MRTESRLTCGAHKARRGPIDQGLRNEESVRQVDPSRPRADGEAGGELGRARVLGGETEQLSLAHDRTDRPCRSWIGGNEVERHVGPSSPRCSTTPTLRWTLSSSTAARAVAAIGREAGSRRDRKHHAACGCGGRRALLRGQHLHFEVRIAGVPVDPLPLLKSGGGG